MKKKSSKSMSENVSLRRYLSEKSDFIVSHVFEELYGLGEVQVIDFFGIKPITNLKGYY